MTKSIARLDNLFWERRLGISTRGLAPVDNPDSVHYATMGYSSIGKVLDHLDLRENDTFVDIGSGKGRVLCCAARRPCAKVIGVDLSAEFNDQARANAEQLRGRRAPISMYTGLAHEFDYSEVTALYLFDPFGAETLDAVLGKIRRDTGGIGVRFAYANNTHDETFLKQTWLERHTVWARGERGMEHAVSFYRGRE